MIIKSDCVLQNFSSPSTNLLKVVCVMKFVICFALCVKHRLQIYCVESTQLRSNRYGELEANEKSLGIAPN